MKDPHTPLMLRDLGGKDGAPDPVAAVLQSLPGRTLSREASPLALEARAMAVDLEARTVDLAFSSEAPVERYDWWEGEKFIEVLGHGAGEVRLERLRNEGPFLSDHYNSIDSALGTVQSVRIDSQAGVGRATVLFRKNERAMGILRDLADGSLSGKVSVGYRVHATELVKNKDGIRTVRVTDWEPHEISLVGVPADDTVGVGRSADSPQPPKPQGETPMKFRNQAIKYAPTTGEDGGGGAPASGEVKLTPEVQAIVERAVNDKSKALEAEREHWRKNQVERSKTFSSIFEQAARGFDKGLPTKVLSDALADPEVTLDAFNESVARAQEEAAKDQKPLTHLDMSEKDRERYDFAKVIRSLYEDKPLEGIEAEAHKAVAERSDKLGYQREAESILIPFDMQVVSRGVSPTELRFMGLPKVARAMEAMVKRDLVVGTDSAGGELVDTVHDAANFIELLYNARIGQNLPIRRFANLRGNLKLPKMTAGATYEWLAEGGAPSESQQTFGNLTLTPHIIGVMTDLSWLVDQQSVPNVGMLAMADIVEQMAQGADYGLFQGSGSANQPTGILNQSGIGSVTGTSVDVADMLEFISDVGGSNISVDNAAFAMGWDLFPILGGRQRISGSDSRTLLNTESRTIEGFRTEITAAFPAATMLFANFSHVIEAFWGVLEVLRQRKTDGSHGTRISARMAMDVGMRHAAAASKATSVT